MTTTAESDKFLREITLLGQGKNIPVNVLYYPYKEGEMYPYTPTLTNLPFSRVSKRKEFPLHSCKYDKDTAEKISREAKVSVSKVYNHNEMISNTNETQIIESLKRKKCFGQQQWDENNPLAILPTTTNFSTEIIALLLKYTKERTDDIALLAISSCVVNCKQKSDLLLFTNELTPQTAYAIFVALWCKDTRSSMAEICREKKLGIKLLEISLSLNGKKESVEANLFFQVLLAVVFYVGMCGIDHDVADNFTQIVIANLGDMSPERATLAICVVKIFIATFQDLLQILSAMKFDQMMEIVDTNLSTLCLFKLVTKFLPTANINPNSYSLANKILSGYLIKASEPINSTRIVNQLIQTVISTGMYPLGYESSDLYATVYLLYCCIINNHGEFDENDKYCEVLLNFLLPKVENEYDAPKNGLYGTMCPKSREKVMKMFIMLLQKATNFKEKMVFDRLRDIQKCKVSYGLSSKRKFVSYMSQLEATVLNALFEVEKIQQIVLNGDSDLSYDADIATFIYGFNQVVKLKNITTTYSMNDCLQLYLQKISSDEIGCVEIPLNQIEEQTELNKPIEIIQIEKQSYLETFEQRPIRLTIGKHVLVSSVFYRGREENEDYVILRRLKDGNYNVKMRNGNCVVSYGTISLYLLNITHAETSDVLRPKFLIYEKTVASENFQEVTKIVTNSFDQAYKAFGYSDWYNNDYNTIVFPIFLQLCTWTLTPKLSWNNSEKAVLSIKKLQTVNIRGLVINSMLFFHDWKNLQKPFKSVALKEAVYTYLQIFGKASLLSTACIAFNEMDHIKYYVYSNNNCLFTSLIMRLMVSLGSEPSQLETLAFCKFLTAIQCVSEKEVENSYDSQFNIVICKLMEATEQFHTFFFKTKFVHFMLGVLPDKGEDIYRGAVNVTAIVRLLIRVSYTVQKEDTAVTQVDDLEKLKAIVFDEEIKLLLIRKMGFIIKMSADMSLLVGLLHKLCFNDESVSAKICNLILEHLDFNEDDGWIYALKGIAEIKDQFSDKRMMTICNSNKMAKSKLGYGKLSETTIESFVDIFKMANGPARKVENFSKLLTTVESYLEKTLKEDNKTKAWLGNFNAAELAQTLASGKVPFYVNKKVLGLYVDLQHIIQQEIDEGNTFFTLKDYGFDMMHLVYLKAITNQCRRGRNAQVPKKEVEENTLPFQSSLSDTPLSNIEDILSDSSDVTP
ncbi:hypothetical protein EIN_169590 [Entamoeba invadens IP1]|uniref:Uncharacterized protein n=1 Tax=Entamoeba invadens IP1 TaxID=370355 RepID=A0A0A1TVM0_ENTIV|nr:hypothetical protein EIN_169590 [Entamoeba invadens IP1]ELP84514.1 hypothetical protein EIN_169590 [Entamoeba invadens IP1]|eukprot:XP_004183860.1 hypothetical protein EIN_169590 [Entamoeba invadens IP1]